LSSPDIAGATIAFARQAISAKSIVRLAIGGFTDFVIKLKFLAGFKPENMPFMIAQIKFWTTPHEGRKQDTAFGRQARQGRDTGYNPSGHWTF
jgi:hypothetical protein